MRGIGWIHVQRPTFTPVVFYDPAGRTIYMSLKESILFLSVSSKFFICST